jgi:hypothetical protein
MNAEAERRLERWSDAPLTWDPVRGGKRPLVCWDDDATYDLGEDEHGARFEAIKARMLSGRYYPPEVIEFYGQWQKEGRDMRPGDRVLQHVRLFGIVSLWAMTEIFIAESSDSACTIGYVTTKRHFGRGKWQATLTRVGQRLSLRVQATAGPGSFWFWLGLPVARWMMVKAWKSAAEDFRRASPGEAGSG